MRIQFGMLCADGGIDIAYPVTLLRNKFHGLTKKNLAVYAIRLCCCIGKMIADIAHIGGTQKCIANSMNQYICIRMTEQTQRVLQTNSS